VNAVKGLFAKYGTDELHDKSAYQDIRHMLLHLRSNLFDFYIDETISTPVS
jgi:hypothetical protein